MAPQLVRQSRTTEIALSDRRRRVAAIAGGLFLILLIPIRRIAGGIATLLVRAACWHQRVDRASDSRGVAFGAVMPLIANDAPTSFLSLVIGENEVSWLGSVGIVMVGALAIWKRLDWNWFSTGAWPTLFAASLAIAEIFVCQNSYSVTFHRLAMTPERLLAWILATAVMLPFCLGFEFLVWRGGIWTQR